MLKEYFKINYKTTMEYASLLYSLERAGYYWNGKDSNSMDDTSIPCSREKGCLYVLPGMGVMYGNIIKNSNHISEVPTWDRKGYCF